MIILLENRASRDPRSAFARYCDPEHFFTHIRTIVLNASTTGPAAITKRTLR
jgi:hypothetical protein